MLPDVVVPTPAVPVSGFAAAPFEPLTDIFARIVAAQGGGGAALAIRHHGEPVVDLVGGTYAVDSLQLLFSVSKSVTAVASAIAHERGLLDLDEPVAAYWPAFAKASTADITPRLVLSHRSGLAAVDAIFTLDELLAGADEQALEIQEPFWHPGRGHGYHAFSYGTLMNGIFRRALGISVGQFVATNISDPLDLDLWIGTPAGEQPRIVPISYCPPALSVTRQRYRSGIPAGSSSQLQATMDLYNDPRIYSAEWPSTSGVGDARSLAVLFAATLDNSLMSSSSRDAMVASRACGEDLVLGIPMQYGSGMQLPFPQLPFLGPGSFGHEGAGGSAAFADTDFDVAVGFTTSVFPPMPGASAGLLALLSTLRHCLTAESMTV